MDILNVLLSILGIGFLIFVHELGHFLAAKKVGIRVDTFALGFQPTIFGWKARLIAVKRGETEYVIGLLPFGGYVKMAGEELEDVKTGSSDEYASKSPSQRAFVLVAGAAMNLIFGFLLFILAFSMGVSFPGTTVGRVLPGTPAWESGLRAGDTITTVNGDPKGDFTDLQTSIALSSQERDLEVGYDRPVSGGAAVAGTTNIRPVLDPNRGILTIGIEPAARNSLLEVTPGSLAATAGLKSGDLLRSVTLVWADGRRFVFPEEWVFNRVTASIELFARAARGEAVEMEVLRKDGDGTTAKLVRIPIGPATHNKNPPLKLGVTSAVRRVIAVKPGSPFRTDFPVGSEVVEINGTPIPTFDLLAIIENSEPGQSTIRVGFRDGSERSLDREQLLLAVVDNELFLGLAAPTVAAVGEGGLAESLGIEVGDELLQIGDDLVTLTRPGQENVEPGSLVTWRRGNETKTGTIPAGVPSILGAELVLPPTIGRVTRGGAADLAGIRDGDLLIRADETELASWNQLLEVIEGSVDGRESKPIELTLLRPPAEAPVDATPAQEVTVVVAARPYDPALGLVFAPDQVTLKLPVGAAIAEGWNQTFVWGKRIFAMLGALARRDVAAKNLAGPVGIVHIGKRVADEGFSKLIFVLAMISINLGVFNLLPFPILDGGHLLFLLIEKIKGSPVDDRIQGWVHLAAFLLLISLALFVTFHDILRLAG